jgi:hypothetical protein
MVRAIVELNRRGVVGAKLQTETGSCRGKGIGEELGIEVKLEIGRRDLHRVFLRLGVHHGWSQVAAAEPLQRH